MFKNLFCGIIICLVIGFTIVFTLFIKWSEAELFSNFLLGLIFIGIIGLFILCGVMISEKNKINMHLEKGIELCSRE